MLFPVWKQGGRCPLSSGQQKGHRQMPVACMFVVPQIRFERTTPALGERCSIP